MDDRQLDALTDSAIDREIRDALAVEPSPEFLVRVRAQIANEPIAMFAPRRVMGLAALAAVVALAVTVSLSRPDTLMPSSSPQVSESQGADSVLSAAPEAPSPASERSSPQVAPPPREAATTRSPRSKQSLPEVLISADDAKAFQQLIAGVREGRFELSFAEDAPVTGSREVTELIVPPIAIEPLNWPMAQEGVSQ